MKTLEIKWFEAFRTIPSKMEDKSLTMDMKAQCWVVGWFSFWKQHMFHLGILSDSFVRWLRRPGMRESFATNAHWYKPHSFLDKWLSISHCAGESAVSKDVVKIFWQAPTGELQYRPLGFWRKNMVLQRAAASRQWVPDHQNTAVHHELGIVRPTVSYIRVVSCFTIESHVCGGKFISFPGHDNCFLGDIK